MANKNVFCPKCGNNMSVDDTREYFFCNKCGTRGVVPKTKQQQTSVKQERNVNVIPSLCTRCNGTLKFSADRESAVCEYCGATYTNKTVYVSRDETEIQRAEYEAQKRKIELEAEERKRKLELEEAERKRQHNKELEESRVKRVKVLAEVWGWIFCIALYVAFILWAVAKHNGSGFHWVYTLVSLDIIFLIVGLIVIPVRLKRARVVETPQKERVIVQEKVIYNNSNNNYVDLNNSKGSSTAGNVAKGLAAGAAIGTGIAAGLAFKGIRRLFK